MLEPHPRAKGARTFAIGDIHGKLSLLKKLIKKLALRRDDLLVFLGDYIDRGEDSRGVVDYLLDLARQYECIFLKGNHDDMFLDFIHQGGKYSWFVFIYNGGQATLDSYQAADEESPAAVIPRAHIEFFEHLRDTYEDERYIYVHAGLAPEPHLEHEYGTHLWIRDSFIQSPKDFGKKVIFGHTPQSAPLFMPNKIGIDTGAYFSGRLTAIELPAERIYQASEAD